jgi:DNA topoisomerase VI subunit A
LCDIKKIETAAKKVLVLEKLTAAQRLFDMGFMKNNPDVIVICVSFLILIISKYI